MSYDRRTDPRETAGQRRCVYCGKRANGDTCRLHRDLPALDPDWPRFRLGRRERFAAISALVAVVLALGLAGPASASYWLFANGQSYPCSTANAGRTIHVWNGSWTCAYFKGQNWQYSPW